MEGKSIYYVLKAFLFIIPLCIVQNNSGQLPAGRVTDKAGRSFRQLKIPIAHKAFDFSHIGGKMGRYTDLAAEMRELNPDIEGIREEETNDGEIKIKRIEILSDTAAQKLGKAQGKYVTLDAEALTQRPLDLFAHVSQCLRRELSELIPLPETKLKSGTVLVVGLGNRGVTPDSLGPRVAERVFVTRHIKEHMPEAFDFDIPSAFSTNADAHWLTDCSLAPAQHIISKNPQNAFCFISSFKESPFSSSLISGAIGTFRNVNPFITGTAAQTSASIFQLSIPNTLKNIVDITTTPAVPQQ